MENETSDPVHTQAQGASEASGQIGTNARYKAVVIPDLATRVLGLRFVKCFVVSDLPSSS